MKKLNKVLPLLAMSLVGMTSVVSAVDDMQVRNLENRVSALEQRRGANGMINPPTAPVVKNGSDLWIQAEVTLMHPTEDGVFYGIKNHGGSSFDGSVKNISYDWSAGWRVGIGYNLPHDGWAMILNYNWLRSSENDSTNSSSPESVYQTWTNPSASTATAVPAYARGHSNLKFDYLDLQMGREFFVSKWLTVRPYMGARGLWVHRNMHVSYKNGELGAGNFAAVPKLKERFNNRFRAGGLLAGLDTQWGLGQGWSFYGQFAMSLLYGTQNLREKQDSVNAAGVATRFLDVKDTWTMVRTMTDLGFGLRWDHLFSDDVYRIRLQFGWEQHLLSGFDKDINFVDDAVQGKFTANQGDLAISGIALQARFDF